MTRCSALLARRCSGDAIGTYSLTVGLGDRRTLPLCGACLDTANQYGYAPSRLPEWQARAVAGQLPTRDLTGRMAA